MKTYNNQNIFNIITCVIIFIIIVYIISNLFNIVQQSESNIANLTDNWIKEVTVNHNPNAIYNLFCPDGNLIGTVSRTIRTGLGIRQYFEYFAKLPGIRVIDRKYNISKITPNVFLNTAFIKWYWNDLDEPVVARMSFIYRDNCIFQLHSSVLPVLNVALKNINDAR